MPSSEPDILTATVQDGPAGSSVVVAAGEIDPYAAAGELIKGL